FVWSLASCGKPAATGGHAEIGTKAPEFQLADLAGNQVASSSLKGKVVILDFWATWCPPCRKEIPGFVELQQKYKGRGLEVVGIALDVEGVSKVRPFAEEHQVNYTMLLGNDDVAKAYGDVAMIPTTFVLDRNGNVVQRFIGDTEPATFEKAILP